MGEAKHGSRRRGRHVRLLDRVGEDAGTKEAGPQDLHDRVHAKAASENKSPSLAWSVYGLIDPRDGHLFYVGMSIDVRRRILEHSSRRESSAFEKCRDITLSGSEVGHCIFGTFALERAAAFLERHLIIAIPQTYNCTHFATGFRFYEPVRQMMAEAAFHGRPRIGTEHQTLAATKPWEAAGMSKRTWFRRQAEKKAEENANALEAHRN